MYGRRLCRSARALPPAQVLAQMGEGRQTLLFSATLPAALAEFARAGLKDPAFVRLDADTKLSPDLRLCFATLRCARGASSQACHKLGLLGCRGFNH